MENRSQSSLEEQIEMLRAQLKKASDGLLDLTCGGSEFFVRFDGQYTADVDACVAYARRVRDSQHQTIIRTMRRARDAERALAAPSQEPQSPIPDEIWEMARSMRNSVIWESNSSVSIIAHTMFGLISHEREQCARIAEAWDHRGDIAKAIRDLHKAEGRSCVGCSHG